MLATAHLNFWWKKTSEYLQNLRLRVTRALDRQVASIENRRDVDSAIIIFVQTSHRTLTQTSMLKEKEQEEDWRRLKAYDWRRVPRFSSLKSPFSKFLIHESRREASTTARAYRGYLFAHDNFVERYCTCSCSY